MCAALLERLFRNCIAAVSPLPCRIDFTVGIFWWPLDSQQNNKPLFNISAAMRV
jgi:hypothetical protein